MTGLKLAICAVISTVCHVFLILPLVTGRVAISEPLSELVPNHPLTLVYLGVVDGESYFLESERTMNWADAKAFCASSNLKLASIETQAQADFLNATLRQHTAPHNYYWTSLHESRRPAMLEWDGTNIAPDTSFLKTWSWDTPAFQYCGLFFLQESTYSMVTDGQRCGSSHISVMCQS